MSRAKVVYIGGVAMSAAEYRRMQRASKPGGGKRRRQRAKWPLVGTALACHPDQVGEMNERNKRLGVNVEYRPDGRPVIPDAGAFKRLRKAEGVVDKDGFY